MEKTGILYGSSGGMTERVAKTIGKKIGNEKVELIDISKATINDFEKYRNLILGTSTWGIGDIQDDWEDFLPDFDNVNLNEKIIALFGLGDSQSYSDSFVDGMGILYEEMKDRGCTFVGQVETNGYTYDDSRAIDNGMFVGLPLDEDNESNLTEIRIDNWLKQILPEFK